MFLIVAFKQLSEVCYPETPSAVKLENSVVFARKRSPRLVCLSRKRGLEFLGDPEYGFPLPNVAPSKAKTKSHAMKYSRLAPIAAVLALLLSTATVEALSGAFPGRACCRGWDYGSCVWGGYALNQDAIATRYIAGANQIAGSMIAAQQSAAMQSGIQNTMSLDAQQRAQLIYAQQQSDHDWLAQSQLQQAAARQLLAMRYSGMLAPAVATTTTTDPTMPEPALDVFRWSFVLQAPQFAAERARVESPYRRTAKSGKPLTAKDYRDINAAVEQM